MIGDLARSGLRFPSMIPQRLPQALILSRHFLDERARGVSHDERDQLRVR
jgi:hypothetical protein